MKIFTINTSRFGIKKKNHDTKNLTYILPTLIKCQYNKSIAKNNYVFDDTF